MRKAFIAVALCCIFLLPPIILVHQRHRESKLKAESAALLAHAQQQLGSVRATDPLYAEVEKHQAEAVQLGNASHSKQADKWLGDDFLKDPKEVSKYEAMDSVHTLLGAIQMTNDPVDRSLLHDFIFDVQPQALPSDYQKGTAETRRGVLATLRRAISGCSADINAKRLEDPSGLWDALSTNTASLEQLATRQADELSRQSKNWPASVLRQASICPETMLKNHIYTYYINTRRPANYYDLLHQRYVIEQSLHKS